MPIQYTLRENALTPEPEDYTASVTPTRTVTLSDVVKRMVAQGSSITSADIFSTFDNFQKAIESLLLEGANINLPFGNYSTSIKGVFKGAGDSFDPTRHQINPVINPSNELRQIYSQGVTTKKLESTEILPNLVEYKDFNSGATNSTVTPGGMAQIMGHRLKFEDDDEQQGIFIINQDNNSQKVAVVGENKPSRLMFMLPADLEKGEIQIEVRAKIYGGIRVGKLPQSLTVV